MQREPVKFQNVFSVHGSASEGSVEGHQRGPDCRGGFLLCAIPSEEPDGNMNTFITVSGEEEDNSVLEV